MYYLYNIFDAKYLKDGMWLNSVVWWALKQRSWFLWWLPLMLQCFSCKNLPKCCYLFDKWLNLLWQPIQTQIEFRYFLLFHSCALLKFRQTFAWNIFDTIFFFFCAQKNVQVFTFWYCDSLRFRLEQKLSQVD